MIFIETHHQRNNVQAANVRVNLKSAKIFLTSDTDIQAKLFFSLIDKDGNGTLSRNEMKYVEK